MTTGTHSRTADAVGTARRRTAIAAAAVAILALVFGALYVAGGDDGAETPDDGQAATLEDGTYYAKLRVDAGGGLELDLVDFLSGDEAAQAAHEDGVLDPSEPSMPNDVYVRNLTTDWQSVERHTDAALKLYDCTTTCQVVGVDWDAYLGGTTTAMNGAFAVYELEIRTGALARVTEVYLP